MLANPSRCPYCQGKNYRLVSIDGAPSEKEECHDCTGTGEVCLFCRKPDGLCECGGPCAGCDQYVCRCK